MQSPLNGHGLFVPGMKHTLSPLTQTHTNICVLRAAGIAGCSQYRAHLCMHANLEQHCKVHSLEAIAARIRHSNIVLY